MQDKKEGAVAKRIENITARVPSDRYLFGAILCMVVSLNAKCFKRNGIALFVGQWVAPILLFGIYNKIVKENAPDQETAASQHPENVQ